MDFTTYQKEARKTAQFPTAHKTTYPILGLGNEAGEFLEKFLDQNGVSDADVIDELGDVMWYFRAVCDIIDITMEEIFSEAEAIKGFYDPLNLFYTTARISGLAKKGVRDRDGSIDREKLIVELKDLANQILTFLPNLETTINVVLARNITKLKDRVARGKIKGDGDKR